MFEIVKSTGALITLATFTDANGAELDGSLTINSAGDLFGTTANGGADGDGTVFEIAKSTGELTTLATFNGSNGRYPERGLTIDAAGDLFGTTANGGANGYGTVFEIAKSTGELTTLATFTGANGENPFGTVISNAAGDLFGTTAYGGADGYGTVFEIAKSTGLLSTLATFTGANGEELELDGGLTINSAGDLFGTTFYGGANNDGTVFELPRATFVATPALDNTTAVTVTDSDLSVGYHVAEHEHRPGLDLGNGREHPDRRRGGQPQSGAELASGRDRRLQRATAIPTSCGRTRAPAKPRSGK